MDHSDGALDAQRQPEEPAEHTQPDSPAEASVTEQEDANNDPDTQHDGADHISGDGAEFGESTSNNPHLSKPVLKFKDCVGRKFSFPFHLVKTWPVGHVRPFIYLFQKYLGSN